MPAFIAHPNDKFRLGDFLTEGLRDASWTSFRAAVAFIKRSGTKHISDALRDFAKRGVISISAGIDSGGTSAEGLWDLIEAVRPKGKLWIFHNTNSSTFHPKIFLFKNADAADLVIGSGNLTEGGLYTNYEGGIRLELSLPNAADRLLLERIEATLDEWSTAVPGLCSRLDAALLKKLVESRKVLVEVLTRETESTGIASTAPLSTTKPLFKGVSVRKAPKARTKLTTPPWLKKIIQHVKATTESTLAPSGRSFLMTLQNTDVGYGKKTSGSSARSPEIFIPMRAVYAAPLFWGWPNLFSVDIGWSTKHAKWIAAHKVTSRRAGRPLEKMDRGGVRFQSARGGKPIVATVWYNPKKNDLRIRHQQLRGAGHVGDILLLRMPSSPATFEYEFDVIKPTDARFADLLASCTIKIPNSQKRIGYI